MLLADRSRRTDRLGVEVPARLLPGVDVACGECRVTEAASTGFSLADCGDSIMRVSLKGLLLTASGVLRFVGVTMRGLLVWVDAFSCWRRDSSVLRLSIILLRLSRRSLIMSGLRIGSNLELWRFSEALFFFRTVIALRISSTQSGS